MTALPAMPTDWEPTRATLHAYAKAVGIIPRELVEPHPKWWHASLTLAADGLRTDPVPVGDGRQIVVRMDLGRHVIVVEVDGTESASLLMTEGMTASAVGDLLIEQIRSVGVTGSFDRERFEDESARPYDPVAAERFLDVLLPVADAFAAHRASLAGEVGPIQVWPHGFDLAFEWFGTRMVRSGENGDGTSHPAQLNLGFYPAGRPYVYSNPWPFEAERLLSTPLPNGATWHTDGWEGTILYYDELTSGDDGRERLLEYAGAVFAAAAPTLTA